MQVLTITGAVFAGIGALLLIIGVVIARANRKFTRRARRAPGFVTGVKWNAVGPQGDATMTGLPELRFTLPDGRVVETVARSGTTLDAMQEGKPVTVLYDPDDPARAQVASGGATALGVAFIAIGGVCVLLGAALVAAGVALDDALPSVIHS
jgi:hypothetical protein